MTAFMMPASLQHVEEAFEVGIGVGMRMIDRMTHTGLRREVDDRRKPVFSEQLIDRRTIRQIDLHETEARISAQHLQPRLLQSRVIVSAEIIQADDAAAFGQQLTGDVKADKARRTCDQNCLIRHHILKRTGSAPPHRSRPLYPPDLAGCNTQLRGYCQIGLKTIPRRQSSARAPVTSRLLATTQNPVSADEMRRILL